MLVISAGVKTEVVGGGAGETGAGGVGVPTVALGPGSVGAPLVVIGGTDSEAVVPEGSGSVGDGEDMVEPESLIPNW